MERDKTAVECGTQPDLSQILSTSDELAAECLDLTKRLLDRISPGPADAAQITATPDEPGLQAIGMRLQAKLRATSERLGALTQLI